MKPDPTRNTRAALIELMAAHQLTRGDIARMLGLKPRPGGSHGTVDMWLSGANRIPVSKLELIALKAPTWKKQHAAGQARIAAAQARVSTDSAR